VWSNMGLFDIFRKKKAEVTSDAPETVVTPVTDESESEAVLSDVSSEITESTSDHSDKIEEVVDKISEHYKQLTEKETETEK